MHLEDFPTANTADQDLPGQLAEVGDDWDVIMVPRYLGLAAVHRLGDKAGTVLLQPESRECCFFVRAGTARRWRMADTTALGRGHRLLLPPASKAAPPGRFWLPPLSGARPQLTLITPLRAALTAVRGSLRRGTAWLASAAPDPARVLSSWEARELADLPAGTAWDVLEMELGLSTMVKGRLDESGAPLGPVMTSGIAGLAWWLLPVGSGPRFAGINEITVHSTGYHLAAPRPGMYVGERTWTVPPDDKHPSRLTDSAQLRVALESSLSTWTSRHPHDALQRP
jgi:hypothetical protein